MNAPSKGRYLESEVKGLYDYHRVEATNQNSQYIAHLGYMNRGYSKRRDEDRCRDDDDMDIGTYLASSFYDWGVGDDDSDGE